MTNSQTRANTTLLERSLIPRLSALGRRRRLAQKCWNLDKKVEKHGVTPITAALRRLFQQRFSYAPAIRGEEKRLKTKNHFPSNFSSAPVVSRDHMGSAGSEFKSKREKSQTSATNGRLRL